MTGRQTLTVDLEAHDLEPAGDSWWALRATCLGCGGPLTHVTDGAPQDAGTHLSIIVACTNGCMRHNVPARYQLTTRIEAA